MKVQPPLSWENFQSSIVVRRQQRVHRVSASPIIEVFGDGILGRVGLWLEVPTDSTVPEDVLKLAFINSLTLPRGSAILLELSVGTPGLFRQFYYFALAVSERILVDGKPAVEAVLLELQSFAELLEAKTLLGIERQLGLLGELMVLERLIRRNGPKAIEAWIGPKGEPHDFRIGTSEYEVKATMRSRRIHTVHGPEQLVPSRGCSLFILSVLLAPAGMAEGTSLAEKVKLLMSLLTSAPSQKQQFTDALQNCGFHDADLPHYERRCVLRRPLAAIPVDGRLPAITRASIQATFGSGAARLDSVEYDVNVEGLEIEDQDPAFAAMFPA